MGAVTGLSASMLMKLKVRFLNVVLDGFLGSAGFSIGWFTVFLIPWRNTITYYVDKTLVTSTTSHYQHPYLVAFAAATILPAVHQLGRLRSLGSNSLEGNPR